VEEAAGAGTKEGREREGDGGAEDGVVGFGASGEC
jgi:hypothetical protein